MSNKKQVSPTIVGEIEVFNFSQEKAPIRVQLINGEPWFVAKDVCEVLEHSNHKMAIKTLDEDEVDSNVSSYNDSLFRIIDSHGKTFQYRTCRPSVDN